MAEEKGKKPKLKKTSQKWNVYEKKGDKVERKNKNCPKCGAGVFMAKHKDRLTCGACFYTEFISKKIEDKK